MARIPSFTRRRRHDAAHIVFIAWAILWLAPPGLFAGRTMAADAPPPPPLSPGVRAKLEIPNWQALLITPEYAQGAREESLLQPCEILGLDDPERAVHMTNLWPGGIVPYAFNANVSATNQQRAIDAMAEIEAVAGIDFIPRTNQSNYIQIQDDTGNYSWVGMIGGGQTIGIASWSWRFIICHELMHALGMHHEQTRPDRNSYIVVHYENINPSNQHNYNITPGSIAFGPYDFESIMHYSQCGFASCTCPSSCVTMTVLPPNQAWQNLLGQRDHLSPGDIGVMQQLYHFGACCMPDGTCRQEFVIDGPDCAAEGGVYQGNDTECETISCAGGACCLPDSSCMASAQPWCLASGGVWGGLESLCASFDCTGYCCLPDGSCAEGHTFASCDSAGGAFGGPASACPGGSCTAAACCLPNGLCVDAVPAAECGAIFGGVWQGFLSTCAVSSCAYSIGACALLDQSCLPDRTLAECAVAGGVYQGNGASCASPAANDLCSQGLPVVPGTFLISNVGGRWDGYPEPGHAFRSDVWFRVVTSCESTLRVSVCDADFDVELALYGAGCPGGFDQALATGAQSCATRAGGGAGGEGGSGGATLAFATEPGVRRIRVGSPDGLWGDATLTIECVTDAAGACCFDQTSCSMQIEADCLAAGGVFGGEKSDCALGACSPGCSQDIAGNDNQVTVADVTSVLSAFGLPCVDCPQDLSPPPDGDNQVTIADINAVLTAFGPCE